MRRRALAVAGLAALLFAPYVFTQTMTHAPVDRAAAVNAVFSRWSTTTPGCAVGVGADGKVLQRAYGMADLEHDVPNTPETIFEAGSVSKQFTAAAVLLLAREGKLSIDDPVRTYIPELPDYGVPLTIRHMLTHTSGLRDWGEVAGIAGWPRGTRTHTHAHVLDIVSRQKALNFTPGTNWSYSNTGYNLAAIIVSRVSGQSFADFSRDRIFAPLGMTHTSWRDDYTRIVKRRAIAYDQAGDGYHQDMPFENVHGNGGLLTTVGDLLLWNENFVTPKVGDAAFVRAEQVPGHFTDGRAHDYAFGLYVRKYRGIAEVSHSGSTAGYRAFLVRYPDQHVSVAVLCNAGNANATQYAHAVADAYLGDALAPAPADGTRGPAPSTPFHLESADLASYPGRYASDEAETVLTVVSDGNDLVIKRRPDSTLRMRPTGKDTFAVPTLGTVTFDRKPEGQVSGLHVKLERVWDLRFQRQ
jgi:CubicO group peptidase (beta-lactamase class C family)